MDAPNVGRAKPSRRADPFDPPKAIGGDVRAKRTVGLRPGDTLSTRAEKCPAKSNGNKFKGVRGNGFPDAGKLAPGKQ